MINLTEEIKRNLVYNCWCEMDDNIQKKVIGLSPSDNLDDFYENYNKSIGKAPNGYRDWIKDNVLTIPITSIDTAVDYILNMFFIEFVDKKTNNILSPSKLTGKEKLVEIDFPADLSWTVYLDDTYMGSSIKEKAFKRGNLSPKTPLKTKKAIIFELFDKLKLGGVIPFTEKEKEDFINGLSEDKVDDIIISIIDKKVTFRYRYSESLFTKLEDVEENYDVNKITGKETTVSINSYDWKKEVEITVVEKMSTKKEIEDYFKKTYKI